MNLESAQIRYLKETLGVREVVMPENTVSSGPSESAPDSSVEFSWGSRLDGPKSARVYVATQRDLTSEESDLICKILKAVGEEQLCLLRLSEFDDALWESAVELGTKSVLIFSDLVSENFRNQLQLSQPKVFSRTTVLLTVSLKGMLVGGPEQVQAHKRKVWSDIQPLKV